MMRAVLLALLPCWALAGEAVLDADTGRVLSGVDADAPRYPASVTKLMTIYAALDAIADGELALEREIVVSAGAAAAPPVKLGLRVGERIRLADALHAALVLSSNDAARAVAEAVDGDEARFAMRMTLLGRAIGLRSTVFRNATGLPDPAHVSTAADMARLAAAVDRRFGAALRQLFRKPVAWRGRRLAPRNGAVAAGALGKTGFTCAAGYVAALVVETPEGRRAAATAAHGDRASRGAALRRLVGGVASGHRPETAGGAPALGRRPGRPEVYALLLTAGAGDTARLATALRAAGGRAAPLDPAGARLLGLMARPWRGVAAGGG